LTWLAEGGVAHDYHSAHITTKDFIGTMIYFVIFTSLMFVKPHKLQPFFVVSFVGVSITILGMFIWAMAVNGGVGDVVAPTAELSTGYAGQCRSPKSIY